MTRIQLGDWVTYSRAETIECPADIEILVLYVADNSVVTLQHDGHEYRFSYEELRHERENDWPWLHSICKIMGHHQKNLEIKEMPYVRP